MKKFLMILAAAAFCALPAAVQAQKGIVYRNDGKTVEFDYAPFGIIGLETAFAVCHTELVVSGVITLSQLIAKLTTGPAEVLGMKNYSLACGNPADFTILDTDLEYVINKNNFKSKSRNTPFDGRKVKGAVTMTVVDGRIVFRNGEII